MFRDVLEIMRFDNVGMAQSAMDRARSRHWLHSLPVASGRRVALRARDHPRNLAHTDSKAVTPISPAPQKFHLLIRCNLLDNSVTLSDSSTPGLTRGECHIADANQHVAEAHPVIIAAVSISDLIIHPKSFWKGWLLYC